MIEGMLEPQNIAVWVPVKLEDSKAHIRPNYSTGCLLDHLEADLYRKILATKR